MGETAVPPRRGSRVRRAIGVAFAAVFVAPVLTTVPAGAEPGVIGRSADEAAVSCWDIKQKDPAATDGAYWLLTPTLPAPQQFHCDMTTDGGGWVLVGRGRDGWQFSYNGSGTADEVHSVVDGPGAFVPRELPAKTIDGLLNGTRPDQLLDGIRLRRATTRDGDGRQEVRFSLTRMAQWLWTFDAPQPVGTSRFDSLPGSGGVTWNFGQDQFYRRVNTIESEAHAYLSGWGFGSLIDGINTSTSYVWSNAGEGNALPFTQVYIRPRLTAENTPFPVVPDSGAPAVAQRPLLSNLSEPGEWGVTGRVNGILDELNTEVQDFAQSGDRMIVGGNFSHVQRGRNASGADRVQQSYLAAFDIDTGDWLPSFRPTLNGQVKALHTLPSGSIVAAGEFTTANGAPAAGVVALDPVTGATDPSFRVSMENRLSNGTVSVAALDAHGDWLYLGGRFTHLSGGARTSPAYARMGARVSLADGTPDGNWNPVLSGSVRDLHASPRGDRVYFAGYFATSNGAPAPKVAVVSTAPGAALVPGLAQPTFSASTNYQQAVREVGDRVWHGGAEHMLFSYTRDTFGLLSGNITRQGGDFQTLVDQSGVVYGGCHCDDFNYSDDYRWSGNTPGTGWSRADNIRFIGAWDAETGAYLPEFVPGLNANYGQGPWGVELDSNGTQWMGGDFVESQTAGGRWQWVGGFVRYRERDSIAPTTPGPMSGVHSGTTTTLRWGLANDDRGGVTYEVLRNDRVVATTGATEITLPSPDGLSRYFVRAVDAAGNRSASTSLHAVIGPK